jgi:hypothetical protein
MSISPMHAALRCRAQSKRTGEPCRAPAVRGWEVCRMQGARGGTKLSARSPTKKPCVNLSIHTASEVRPPTFPCCVRFLVHAVATTPTQRLDALLRSHFTQPRSARSSRARDRVDRGRAVLRPPHMQAVRGEVDGPIGSILVQNGGFLALSAGLSGDVDVDR